MAKITESGLPESFRVPEEYTTQDRRVKLGYLGELLLTGFNNPEQHRKVLRQLEIGAVALYQD